MWGTMLFITKKDFDMSWLEEFLEHKYEIYAQKYEWDEAKDKAAETFFITLEEYCYDDNAENGIYEFVSYKDWAKMIDKNGNECYHACIKDIDLQQPALQSLTLLIYDEEHRYESEFDFKDCYDFNAHVSKVLQSLDENIYLHILAYHF